jgi:hypothetical protein
VFPNGNTDSPSVCRVRFASGKHAACHPAGKEGSSDVHYAGFQDLVKRWPVYTPRGVRKLVSREDFPKPYFSINGGKTHVWFMPDVERFEAVHPEVTSESAKRQKVAAYAIGNLKKKARQG